MKKLQNNFTTPEQSKRLLEIGVPADSADETLQLYYEKCSYDNAWVRKTEAFNGTVNDFHLPCWSVGRLIEIYCICMGIGGFPHCYEEQVSNLILAIVTAQKAGSLDFSKLEE